MSGLRPFQRRSFLQGVASGVAGAVVGAAVAPGVVQAATQDDYNMEATRDGLRAVPFYGRNQAGIATAPQTAASFLTFDVIAANRGALTALFRTLTARAAFLTAGGTPPPTPSTSPPSDDRLLGPTVLPDDFTVTVGLGASLFEDRYGLGPSKPAQLETMQAFAHDNLDPAISNGDLLVQLCAGHRDTVGHAMLDILAHTGGGMRLWWRIDGFRFPPRPVGIPRDWMGFKDGITNPDTTNTTQMNQEVWVQPGTNDVSVIDTRTNRVVRVVPAGQYPAGVAVTHDGVSVYVANELSADVTVIDTRSGAVEATLPSGTGPFNVATSPTDNSAYVTDLGPGKLVVFDTRTRQTSSTVTLGSYGTDPFSPAATRHTIYVTDQGANTLSVIDPQTLNVVTTVRTGNSPYCVAVLPGG